LQDIDPQKAFSRNYEFKGKASGPTREAVRVDSYTPQAGCSATNCSQGSIRTEADPSAAVHRDSGRTAERASTGCTCGHATPQGFVGSSQFRVRPDIQRGRS